MKLKGGEECPQNQKKLWQTFCSESLCVQDMFVQYGKEARISKKKSGDSRETIAENVCLHSSAGDPVL